VNKNVLVITPPTEFMVFDRFRTCLRFSAIGGTLITSMINKEKYNVNYFDIDAFMIKNFEHISLYFSSEDQLMHELKYYLCRKDSDKTLFFDNLTQLISLLMPLKQYDYILCSLPCYGNSRKDCENQMRMASIIIRSLKETKGTPITVAGGNWWENLDVEYWKLNVVDPTQIIDFLIFGSMKLDEINDLLETGYARKAYHKNPERDPKKSFTGKGKFFGKDLGHWGGYYKFDPGNKESGEILQSLDQNPFINKSDIRYTFQEVFDFYRVKNPQINNTGYIQQGSIFFTDGCIGTCAFCETGDRKFKPMPFNMIKDMIKRYVLEWGYNSLFFKNSAINPTRKFADKFCNWLIKENLNILWSDSARFHKTDSDFFDMIWESGCRSLGWGCEVADDDMLRFINKNLTVKEMSLGLRLSHERGIWNIMNFIFGMPGENSRVIENTLNWIKEHSICMDECHYNDYCVKPNSPFYLTPEKFGLIKKGGNVLDPKFGLDSEQTYKYRKEIKFFATQRLLEYKHLELHVSQILTFPLYWIFDHNKLKVREWLKTYYTPYSEIFEQNLKGD
jgi:radical SAM superfamily enzyme YgiQ (UPF0313 family)